MRILLSSAAVFAAITAASAPAAVQYPIDRDRPGYDRHDDRGAREIAWRLDLIYDRIEWARRSGRVSPGEARRLHATGQSIHDRFRADRRNGLDRWEYRELSRRIRDLRERMRWDFRRGYDRYEDGRRDERGGQAWDRGDDGNWDERRETDWNDERRWSDDAYGDGGRDDWQKDRQGDRQDDWRDDRSDRDIRGNAQPDSSQDRRTDDDYIDRDDNARWDSQQREDERWLEPQDDR